MNMNDTESNEIEDFAAMLDQVQVNLDVSRDEIHPCKAFPTGATILAKQNGRVTFAVEVGKITIDFACDELDKEDVPAQAAHYARNFEKGLIPVDVLNCLVR